MAADYLRRHASLFGIPIRNILLVALVIQNAGISVLLHYSRHMPLVNGERYFASTAVLLTEVLKLAFFLSMALYDISTNPQSPESSTIGELAGALSRAMFTGDSWKLAIPAMLYTLQNSLQYVAASNLDAATFSLAFQLKVVATAVLSSVFLGRALDLRKWASLAVMAFGVFMVQMSAVAQAPGPLSMKDLRDGVSFHSPRSMWEMEAEGNVAAGQLNKRSATYEGIDEDVLAANPRRNVSVGVGAVVVACILSGVAGVYFEKTLKAKDARASIWVRNVQLSFYSIWPALFLGVTFMDGEHFAKTGFFTGYNWVVWTVIGVQALGGVLIGLALNYTDGVTKGLATSVSAAIVVVVDALSTEINTAGMHWLGTAATLGAAYFFSSKTDDKALRPPPINVTQYEKDERGYFDLEATATPARSPLQNTFREGTSTSRPGTPGSEPRMRVKSPGLEMRMSKRDQ